jgi:hypothetical protein
LASVSSSEQSGSSGEFAKKSIVEARMFLMPLADIAKAL